MHIAKERLKTRGIFARIRKSLKILRQFSPKEKIFLILIWLFDRTVGKKKIGLYEMKYLLRDMSSDNYRVQKLGKNNIVKIFDDPDIGNAEIILRRTTSDIPVFRQIFIEKEYQSLIDRIGQMGQKEDIKYIIDAGANIGCSMIYFKKAFPGSTIICVEPEQSNYKCLLENIKLNGVQNVVPVNAALWVNNGCLVIDKNFRDKREWAFTVNPTDRVGPDCIRGITINDICADYSMPRVDILKIDIEGAERFLFESEERARSFLPLVRYLAMEIHDEFNIRDGIIVLLKKFNFSYFYSGELIIARNQNFNPINRPAAY